MRELFTKWVMDIAEHTKLRSTCVSRQVGAVIVKDKRIIATGFNGSPAKTIHCSDIGYCERRKRGIESGKGLEICRAGHAEANAIFQCAKYGTIADGSTLYVTTQPCVFCSIAIIQAGIKKVVFKGEYPTGLGAQLLEEGNVEYIKYEDELKKEEKYYKIKHKHELEEAKMFINKPKSY